MVDIITPREHLQDFLDTTENVSEGVLNDQRPRSVLSVLGRAFAEGLNGLETRLNQTINDQINLTVPKLFGFVENAGIKAQIVLSFTPTQIDNARSFIIGTGFRVDINGWTYQTDSELSVSPGALNGQVTATAINPGSKGNIVGNPTDIDWEPIQGLLSVRFVSMIITGKDAQTVDNLSEDITQALINRSLITAENYQYTVRQILGNNSAVAAIANLGKDKATFERGTIHIFGSTGGLALTDDQKRTILAELEKGWATVYISDITIKQLYIQIFLKAVAGVNQTILTASITDMLRSRYSSATYTPGTDIDLYDLIGALYKLEGIEQIGLCQFHTGSGIFEALDIPLKNYETVQFNSVRLQYV